MYGLPDYVTLEIEEFWLKDNVHCYHVIGKLGHLSLINFVKIDRLDNI